MKCFAMLLFAVVLLACLASSAEAQWVRRYYQPMWVAPQPMVVAPAPVVVGPRPVTVYRPPLVTYQPTQVVTARNRPILGGTVIRTRPGYRRVVW
jgi:hypothetical protein